MKLEYYVVAVLLAANIVFFFLYRHKKRKHSQELLSQKECYKQRLGEQQQEMLSQKEHFEQDLAKLQNEINEHKKQISQNLEKTIPYGERLLIKEFLRLFKDPLFKDFTIYSHLDIESKGGFCQADFLIVSPKGLFVIESKRWKDITYIYSGSCHNLFSGTKFDIFGTGSNQSVKIFNASDDEEYLGRKILSEYTNPVAQARNYSRLLVDILNVKPIKNMVIFNVSEKFKVLYDDKPLGIVGVDRYTTILSDAKLEDFFRDTPDNQANIASIIQTIDQNMVYLFKLDVNNYLQVPFSLV